MSKVDHDAAAVPPAGVMTARRPDGSMYYTAPGPVNAEWHRLNAWCDGANAMLGTALAFSEGMTNGASRLIQQNLSLQARLEAALAEPTRDELNEFAESFVGASEAPNYGDTIAAFIAARRKRDAAVADASERAGKVKS